jgi:hypothetical protein
MHENECRCEAPPHEGAARAQGGLLHTAEHQAEDRSEAPPAAESSSTGTAGPRHAKVGHRVEGGRDSVASAIKRNKWSRSGKEGTGCHGANGLDRNHG